jgi:hypothetical protein
MNEKKWARLKSLAEEDPTRLSSLIRLIWPQIRSALRRGHTLKVIHGRLKEEGLAIRYNLFAYYVARLRREESGNVTETTAAAENSEPTPKIVRDAADKTPAEAPPDPLANVRERLNQKSPGFHRNGGVPDKKKLYGDE